MEKSAASSFIRIESAKNKQLFEIADLVYEQYLKGFTEIAIGGFSVKITEKYVICSMDNPLLNCFNQWDGAMSSSDVSPPGRLNVRDSGRDIPKTNPNQVTNYALANFIFTKIKRV